MAENRQIDPSAYVYEFEDQSDAAFRVHVVTRAFKCDPQ